MASPWFFARWDSGLFTYIWYDGIQTDMKTDFKGKKILIVGFGKTGTAALEELIHMGAVCAVQDAKTEDKLEPKLLDTLKSNNVKCYLGTEPKQEDLFDMLVLSPGVPPTLKFIQNARSKGSEVIGELELAFRISKGIFVSITGTNGKTTTTALLGEIFRNAGRDTYVVGNIGTAVTSVARRAKAESWIITETSSFQLETTEHFKPYISVLLNVSPDHLDRHGDMENYIDIKTKIFKNQDKDDYVIVNYDNRQIYEAALGCRAKIVPFSRLAKLPHGVFVKAGKMVAADEKGFSTEIVDIDRLLLPGLHNLENALAAVAAAYYAGIPVSVIANTLKTFKGVSHRLEFCGRLEGVTFINDSKGTNPDAAIKAIEAVKGRIILIAGGADKNTGFGHFVEAFGGKVKHTVLLGATAQFIKEAAESKGFYNNVILKTMEDCVAKAFELAEPGDTVLLSPACASLDMYSCFEERGEDFKSNVSKLRSKK